eukprot:959242-Pelagomonas_calceolata.AAC.6
MGALCAHANAQPPDHDQSFAPLKPARCGAYSSVRKKWMCTALDVVRPKTDGRKDPPASLCPILCVREPWEAVRSEMIEEKGLPAAVADRIGDFVVLSCGAGVEGKRTARKLQTVSVCKLRLEGKESNSKDATICTYL